MAEPRGSPQPFRFNAAAVRSPVYRGLGTPVAGVGVSREASGLVVFFGLFFQLCFKFSLSHRDGEPECLGDVA